MIIENIISIIAYLILAPLAGGLLAGLDRKTVGKDAEKGWTSLSSQPFYDVFKLF